MGVTPVPGPALPAHPPCPCARLCSHPWQCLGGGRREEEKPRCLQGSRGRFEGPQCLGTKGVGRKPGPRCSLSPSKETQHPGTDPHLLVSGNLCPGSLPPQAGTSLSFCPYPSATCPQAVGRGREPPPPQSALAQPGSHPRPGASHWAVSQQLTRLLQTPGSGVRKEGGRCQSKSPSSILQHLLSALICPLQVTHSSPDPPTKP